MLVYTISKQKNIHIPTFIFKRSLYLLVDILYFNYMISRTFNSSLGGFQFCEDDDDIEQLFQSAFGGNKHFFWSFMSDEPPRTSSGYNYNSRYSSRWKWTHEEDYGTDPDKSESDLTSERKTLGLSSSGPLNADDVKIA